MDSFRASGTPPLAPMRAAKNYIWTYQLESLMVTEMEEQCAVGQRIANKDDTFHPQAWEEMEVKLNTLPAFIANGVPVKKVHMYNHLWFIKKYYSNAKTLLQCQSRFGWDSDLKKVTAESEVWLNYELANPWKGPPRLG